MFSSLANQVSNLLVLKHGHVTIDGSKWKYIEHGNPGGEVIFFIHGLGGNKSLWSNQIQEYDKTQYRCIAIDIPGACMSQFFATKRHTINELSRWLDKVFSELGINSAHLVSHSSLNLLATYYASTRGNKIISLTLIAYSALLRLDPDDPNGMVQNFIKDINHNNVDEMIAYFNSLFYTKPSVPRPIALILYRNIKRSMPQLSKVAIDYFESIPIILAHTKKVECPTLIINGDSDKYIPMDFHEELRAHYPKASIHLIEKCGHVCMLEKPEALLGIHKAFLRLG